MLRPCTSNATRYVLPVFISPLQKRRLQGPENSQSLDAHPGLSDRKVLSPTASLPQNPGKRRHGKEAAGDQPGSVPGERGLLPWGLAAPRAPTALECLQESTRLLPPRGICQGCPQVPWAREQRTLPTWGCPSQGPAWIKETLSGTLCTLKRQPPCAPGPLRLRSTLPQRKEGQKGRKEKPEGPGAGATLKQPGEAVWVL